MNMTDSGCKLVRVMNAIINEPWLLTPDMHRVLTQIATAHAFGGAAENDQHIKAATFAENPKKRDFAMIGNVAVIPVEGVIGRKFSDTLYSSGVTSVDIFQRMLNNAADDDAVDAILISMDSPGGAVTGVPEAAAAVGYSAQKKPVIAYADGQMCSAAYYLASAASQIYALPSAQVGSIGVYLSLLDMSRAAEMQGIRVELFKSGKFKGMGQPGTSLNDEQRAMLQARVDKIGKKFRSDVVTGRQREIDPAIMQGQSFDADEAMTAGLIDGITNFEGALSDAAFAGRIARQQKGKRQ